VIPFDKKVAALQQKNVGINVGINVGLNDLQKKILKCLLEKPTATAEMMAGEFAVSSRTVERALLQLQKTHLIIRTGARKNGAWIVVKDNTQS